METKIKRPEFDNEMLDELAKEVGETVFKWADGESDLEDCIEAARKILKYHSRDNGYELAKEFEDEGFSPDTELVEELDYVSGLRYQIEKKYTEKWVIENNIKLELAIGQKVKYEDFRFGWVVGEITKLYEDEAKYGVWHEKSGLEKGKGHTIMKFEAVTAV